MTKSEIEKECLALKERLNTIEENAKLSAATSQFLCKQAEKLMLEGQDFDLPFQRREQLVKEMEALKKRMEFEATHVHDDDTEMQKIYHRIVELQDMYNRHE